MARTGGDETKARILAVAERLFAERGFDATSVDSVAAAAGVNKALIYYHFRDKAELMGSLFTHILDDLGRDLERSSAERSEEPASAIRQELRWLESRKRILRVMLMEALKPGPSGAALFRCAELVIERENQGRPRRRGREGRRHLVHEFFTGFVPLLAFVALRDRFCEHFGCGRDEALTHFLDAFADSHLGSHL
jgi:AcrR family transcriptional regulator